MPDTAAPTPLRTEPHPLCPLCGAPGAVHHAGLRDRAFDVPGEWSLRRCRPCALGWLDPQPTDEDLGRCYPATYYTHAGAADPPPPPGSALGRPGAAAWVRDAILAGRYGYDLPGMDGRRRRIGRLLGALPPVRARVDYRRDRALPLWRAGGRLLDIGCGSGGFLAFARSLGWQGFGLDPDPAAVAVAHRTGAIVEQGTLDTAHLVHAPFDAVTSMHSIEHARDPRLFLRHALAALRPGGFFYLQTPNLDGLMHRRFGPDWYALEVPRHLTLLTVPSLRRLLREEAPWQRLVVRSNPRRAVREQEQTLAMRREGSFEAFPAFSRADRAGMAAWSLLEHAGNAALGWGEELEAIGVRA